MRSRRPFTFLAPLTLVAVLAGCGSGDDDAGGGDDAIASLGTSPEDTSASDSSTVDSSPVDPTGSETTERAAEPPSTDPEEAMLDYVECMREHGVDMPDPEPGGRINMTAGEGEGAVDPETMDEADQACQPLMEAATSNIDQDPEALAERQEELLAFAECMREHGIDMPDPEFDEDGRITMENTDGGQAPDPDEYEEAQEACGTGMMGDASGTLPDE